MPVWHDEYRHSTATTLDPAPLSSLQDSILYDGTGNHDPRMNSSDDHIYSFDISRAIAAIAVVLLHWGEFAAPGSLPPFAQAFGFFYRFGALAVPLFFVLSGFVFAWLYATPVRHGRITAGSFFVLRFSRLYPLFFVTFVVIAIEFLLAGNRIGYSFDSLHTDAYHALLTLLMMTGWGLEHGFSFNGPSWTVSTEVFLYGAFFVVVRRFGIRPVTIAAMIVAGLALMPVSVHLAGGLVQFFAGVAAHRFFVRWSTRQSGAWIVAAAAIAIVLTMAYGHEYRSRDALALLHDRFPHATKLDTRYQIVRDLLFPALLFPLVVFLQAALERRLSAAAAILHHPIVAWAGNVSYSLYLWHYPLMIGCAILAGMTGASPFLFYSPAIFLAYAIVLVVISHLSYYRFERPMMRCIRARFAPRRPDAASSAFCHTNAGRLRPCPPRTWP